MPDPKMQFSIAFADSKNGWAVGEGRHILMSMDGENSWSEQYGYRNQVNVGFLFGVAVADSRTGWAVGWQMMGSKSVILSTTNGGQSWRFQNGESIHSGFDGMLHGVAFADTKKGWAVGTQGRILRTNNGGRTWAEFVGKPRYNLPHHFDFIIRPDLHDVTALDRDTAWAVGAKGTILKAVPGKS